MNKGQPRKVEDWRTLELDYFETDNAVDTKQIGLEDHSRYGKVTAVAMAYDYGLPSLWQATS